MPSTNPGRVSKFGWILPEIENSGELRNSDNTPKTTSQIRACINCVKAKAKCGGRLLVGGKCDRCQRMNKDCQPSPAARKRKAVKGTSKTALLEEKLEGLVELLKARTSSSDAPLVNQELNPESVVGFNEPAASTLSVSSCHNSSGGILSNQDIVHVLNNEPVPKTGPKAPTIDPTSPSSGPIVKEISPQQAQECLETFRSRFLRYLPIIFIPAAITVDELRQSRPFLWCSILTVCVKSSRYQHAVAEELRVMIGRETFVEGRKNLDLLQAILVFSSWDQRHLFYKHIMGNLMHISMAIVNDLALNRPPHKPSQLIFLDYDDRGCPKVPRSNIRTLDERRALIGCFLLSSLGASFFQKGDSMRWTSYLEECCKVLEEERETTDDITLIQLARSHLIVDKIFRSPWHDHIGDAHALAPLKPPAELYVKSLESQLQEFKRNIPLKLQQSEIMLLEIYSIEVSIYAVALSKTPNLFNDQSFQRLEYLYACLRSLKSWFNVFFGLPASHLFGFPINIYCQMAHCMVCLYRLSTCEFQNWDTAFVRNSVNFLSIVQQIMDRLKEVKPAVGLDIGVAEGIDNFSFLAEKLLHAKNWWEKIATNFTVPSMDAQLNVGDNVSVEFLEDTWFSELLAPWDPANLHYTDFFNTTV